MREALISFPMFGEDFVLNPPAYFLIGSFPVYLYGVTIAIGFLAGVLYVSRLRDVMELTMDQIYDFLIFGVPVAILCARAYYVVFNWSLYADDPAGILRIRDGGLAIYGGVIGAAVTLVLRARRLKVPVGAALDMAGFGLPVGQCIGRWGNFFNRECYGYETDIFCRMGLTPPGGETIYVHPTFLYESLWNLLGVIVMYRISRRGRKYPGEFFLIYLLWYGAGRFWIEGLRTDSLWLVPDVIRVSQLLAAVSALAALALLLYFHGKYAKNANTGEAAYTGTSAYSAVPEQNVTQEEKAAQEYSVPPDQNDTQGQTLPSEQNDPFEQNAVSEQNTTQDRDTAPEQTIPSE